MEMLNCFLKIGNKGFWVVLSFLLVLFMEMTSIIASKSNSSYQNFQVEAQLKLLNKPAVKSIKSPDGDIIDCIKISDQRAFDHPLLRNHTIQMAPSFYPEGVLRPKKVSSQKKRTKTQLWQLKGSCPKGTIPVRRTKKEDLLRASSIKDFGKKKHRSIPQPRSANLDVISQSGFQHQLAIAYVIGNYYGAKAVINVWDPTVEPTESSLSQIWVAKDLNTVEAGWQVSADLYGDNNTRFFISWTSDDYQTTGCYNLLCSGFVQTSNEIAMGATLSPISTYQGSQYAITLLVWKDPKTPNWWLQFGNEYELGYWPSSLFSSLADSASVIHWGGQVLNSNGQHTTTEMGSGHFPEEGYGISSYFNNLQIIDGSNAFKSPEDIGAFTEQSNCYDIKLGKSGDWGNYFYFGGLGRSPVCP